MIQRVGWSVLLVVVIAALAGLIGHGALSSKVAVSPDGNVRLEYEKYLHYAEKNTLELSVDLAGSGDELRITLGREWLDKAVIQRIMPEPVREELGDAENVFVFRAGPGGGSKSIRIHFEPHAYGSARGTLRVNGSAALDFEQFIYP
jgi:hypothetical protein